MVVFQNESSGINLQNYFPNKSKSRQHIPQVYIAQEVQFKGCDGPWPNFCPTNKEVYSEQWAHQIMKFPESEFIGEQMKKPLPDFSAGCCVAMVPITPTYSPVIAIPCDRNFTNASYMSYEKYQHWQEEAARETDSHQSRKQGFVNQKKYV